jgi:hypothetical protein
MANEYIMKHASLFEIGKKYKSSVNWVANSNGIMYEVVKKMKRKCKVRVWDKDKPTEKYYTTPYSALAN